MVLREEMLFGARRAGDVIAELSDASALRLHRRRPYIVPL